MTACEHMDVFDLVLTQYDLRLDDMVAVVVNNTVTNKAISRRVGCQNCTAHRFNLARGFVWNLT
ncbi:hypothetical protein PHMEG_0007251 [Phytophthora megakarya]|uniref:Transposase n=1 Tax=Phytophthora megakarya TaxID=4795 RepID=A0A225WMY2_9STRA|nr:hypothetical protein PHMEG_0007251 [Phytophthora megakarya]